MAIIPFRWTTTTEPMRARRVGRLLDSFLTDFESAWGPYTPSLDIVENEKNFEIHVELPGMEEKDIDVSLDQNVLTIKGEKKSSHSEEFDGFRRIERSYGSFQRSIPFATDLDENKVEAAYEKGVLHITLPKAASAIKEAKKINIKSSASK